MSTPDFTNLQTCIDDVQLAGQDSDPGPGDPTDYTSLRSRLFAASNSLPPLYKTSVYDPFVATLDELGPVDFVVLLTQRPDLGDIVMDIAHAILQNAEGYQAPATDGFQEVVSDLYDGFLSAEDRVGVEPPDHGVIPPLVKWGRPQFGPYTYTTEATQIFGVQPGIVSLPPAFTRRGLLGWSSLGHETAGHDILHADTGLHAQLAAAVFSSLDSAGFQAPLARYWRDRIDETASDVMGILNMGPAAGIGLIGFFRGLNAAFGNGPILRNNGPSTDVHPADIVRGYLAAAVVRLLEFSDHDAWADALESETDKDAGAIRLAGISVTMANAKRMAKAVAEAIVTVPMASLEQHALGDIQNWRDHDESIVAELIPLLTSHGTIPETLERGIFAAHAVAAGVVAGLANGANTSAIFSRMQQMLKRMHDHNPAWGPLFVQTPGNLAMHRMYIPQENGAPVAAPRAARRRRRVKALA
jgi:hypothetical protein